MTGHLALGYLPPALLPVPIAALSPAQPRYTVVGLGTLSAGPVDVSPARAISMLGDVVDEASNRDGTENGV
jgi:hypothetical protein